MKKIIAMLLVVSMLFMFVGCGKDDKTTPPTNEFPTTSNTQNNTANNQSTTTIDPSSGNSTTSTPPTSGYPFEKGSVNDFVYINNWANMKFDMLAAYGGWAECDASEYTAIETGEPSGFVCGFAAQSVSLNRVIIAFQELSGDNANSTETEYLEDLINQAKSAGDSEYTFSGLYDSTIANATYKSFDATYIDSVIHYSARRLDNYLVIIGANCSKEDLPTILNGIQTVR